MWKLKSLFWYDWLVVSNIRMLIQFFFTYLVEQEIWPIPWDWEHAPHQEQALHYQVGREGVTENVQDDDDDNLEPDDSPEWVDDGVQEELHEGEDSKDDPVPQPSTGTLWWPVEDRLERHEGGVDHPDQGAGDECVQVHGGVWGESAGDEGVDWVMSTESKMEHIPSLIDLYTFWHKFTPEWSQ